MTTRNDIHCTFLVCAFVRSTLFSGAVCSLGYGTLPALSPLPSLADASTHVTEKLLQLRGLSISLNV